MVVRGDVWVELRCPAAGEVEEEGSHAPSSAGGAQAVGRLCSWAVMGGSARAHAQN